MGRRRKHKVYRQGKVHVMAQMCATCIFRPDSEIPTKRVEEMVREATANDGCIPCHETMDTIAPSICAGFFTHHATAPLQIAHRLGCVEFVKKDA